MPADLFTPLTLRETELPNRLIVSPMCQYSVDDCDGVATEWHHVHLDSRAVGGAGLVMAEATAVEPRGRIAPGSSPEWVGPNYQLPLAEHVRENTESDIAIGTVGGTTTPQQADTVVRNGRADLAIVGRQFLRDPYSGLHAAELCVPERNEPPVQYRRVF